MPLPYILFGATLFTSLVMAYFLWESRSRYDTLSERLQPIVTLDAEVARLKEQRRTVEREMSAEIQRRQAELGALQSQLENGRSRMHALAQELASLEENLENVDIGLYKPHFTYADSEAYKAAIESVRARQKEYIKRGAAARCGTTWTVGGSQREGERMIKQTQKLFLRAFNAESEAAVANVTWQNYKVMQTRIGKAFDALNKLGTVLQVQLTSGYRDLRLEELRLVYEAAERKRQEREEQRRMRAQQREEERVQRELRREREEADREETLGQRALAKIQQQLLAATENERAELLDRIRQLEVQIAEAHARKERAIAQAQLTRVGHVYIISNVGAFGETIVKIGLTRRLDPIERVQELGDASVPFPFDLHALIHSEDAPALEARLHEAFWDRRVNWANDRKEFFRVSLAELRDKLTELGINCDFTELPEAREYRLTLAAVGTGSGVVAGNWTPTLDSVLARQVSLGST